MSPAAERQPTEGKVIRFEQFQAARAARHGAGIVEPAGEQRALTAPEIAHRFAMLGHLRGVERVTSEATGLLVVQGHMSTKAENIDTLA